MIYSVAGFHPSLGSPCSVWCPGRQPRCSGAGRCSRGTALADAPLPPLPGTAQRGYGEGSFLLSTVPPPQAPGCALSPGHGSVLTAFRVSCSAPGSEGPGRAGPGGQLTYCFYVTPGKSPADLFGFSWHELCRETAQGWTMPWVPALREQEVSLWWSLTPFFLFQILSWIVARILNSSQFIFHLEKRRIILFYMWQLLLATTLVIQFKQMLQWRYASVPHTFEELSSW